jgi:hypothetical protein
MATTPPLVRGGSFSRSRHIRGHATPRERPSETIRISLIPVSGGYAALRVYL